MAMHNEVELLDFAKQKLLNGASTIDSNPEGSRSRSLACLCVRFALEFNADAISRDVACTQVERHMRLCLSAMAGFERLFTIAGSEPLLAEAASQLTGGDLKKPVDHLADHFDLDCIDRGRRGELVATMIVMQARDDASAAQRSRWITVSGFMEALLPHDRFEEVLNSVPTLCDEDNDKPFGETFKDYAMWFNHVVRIKDPAMIKSEHLWTFITRGAMVVCTDNQDGVDIVLPLCPKTGNISRDTVSAILIQVKNAKRYRRNIDNVLFNKMDPIELGIFEKNSPRRPIIRMVFALAAPDEDDVDEDDVSVLPKEKRKKEQAKAVSSPGVRTRYSRRGDKNLTTTFDIWCAGLSEKTFKGNANHVTPYKVLLNRLLQVDKVFTLREIKDDFLDEHTRRSRGSLRRRMAALTFSEDDHLRPHVQKKSNRE